MLVVIYSYLFESGRMYKYMYIQGFKTIRNTSQWNYLIAFILTYSIHMWFFSYLFFNPEIAFPNCIYGRGVCGWIFREIVGYFCFFFQKTYPSFSELEASVIEFIWERVMRLLYDMVAVQFNYISSPFLRRVWKVSIYLCCWVWIKSYTFFLLFLFSLIAFMFFSTTNICDIFQCK